MLGARCAEGVDRIKKANSTRGDRHVLGKSRSIPGLRPIRGSSKLDETRHAAWIGTPFIPINVNAAIGPDCRIRAVGVYAVPSTSTGECHVIALSSDHTNSM